MLFARVVSAAKAKPKVADICGGLLPILPFLGNKSFLEVEFG